MLTNTYTVVLMQWSASTAALLFFFSELGDNGEMQKEMGWKWWCEKKKKKKNGRSSTSLYRSRRGNRERNKKKPNAGRPSLAALASHPKLSPLLVVTLMPV